jgi:hypothetical protein
MSLTYIFRIWPILVVLSAASLACSTPVRLLGLEQTQIAPVETAQLAASPVSTATEASPLQTATQPAPTPFEVRTEILKEERSEPPSPYVIDLEYPQFHGTPQSAAEGLNQHVNEIVARQRAGFDEMVSMPTPAEFQVGPHGFYMRYEVHYNDGKYVSIYFLLSLYSSGAAHPLPYSETLTYDAASERVLQLADLFQPGSDYLTVLSEKSIASLQSRDITGGESGAVPIAENYRNWNLSPDGLLITFDPYQVAPYAAGYQTILIPWAELSDILAFDI